MKHCGKTYSHELRTVIAKKDRGRTNALLLSKLDHRRRRHDGATGTSKRAVSHDVDALFVAQVDNLLLRQARVVFDLIDSGNNLGMGKEFLEVLLAILARSQPLQRREEAHVAHLSQSTYIAHPNGLGFATCQNLLHLLPGLDVAPALDNVARAIGMSRELVVIAYR